LENAAKVPADTCGHWVARGLTQPLTMGWPHKCVYYSFRVTRVG
jgi:hypothetical protein